MPLIDLKTNLKSLKYGKDRINEGSSGQPYITTDPDGATNLSVGPNNVLRLLGVNKIPLIPNVSSQLNRSRVGRFVNQVLGTDDFIRGGAIGSAQAAINDTFRIGSFLTSLPKGPIFIAKQVGLQLSNPKLEVKKGLGSFIGGVLKAAFSASPTQALSSVTGGLLGPTRVYNAGINTLAQVPANAFGIHFSRHGILPIQDDETKYEKVVTFNNQSLGSKNNRLVELVDKFSLGDQQYETNPNFNLNAAKKANRQANRQNKRVNKAQNQSLLAGSQSGGFPYVPVKFKRQKLNIDDKVISSYPTGPGSTYGIGLTIIQRYSFTEDKLKIEESLNNAANFGGRSRITIAPVEYTNALGEKAKLSVKTAANSINAYSNEIPGSTTGSALINAALRQGINETYAALVSKINATANLSQTIPSVGTYSAINPVTYNNTITTVTGSLLRDAPNFRYYGSASLSISGSKQTYNNSDVFSRNDAGIMSVVFRAINPFTSGTETWIFPAYINGYKDDFNATWNDVNYAGRAESFYIYSKFKRTVSFNLKVPCFNKIQLFEKHRALGQLASVTAGSYNNNLLGGVLIKINLGNYLVGEYAVLNSVNYSIPDDASWDIADDALLSMYIDASFSLTIVHKELPQYQQSGPGVLKNGFFGYLPNLVNPVQATQTGFITSADVVNKFRKDK